MSDALGVKYTTFTDWVKGNSYPRIDKIELMENYFGISKADLVIATVNGTDATCKRPKKYTDGIALIATNPTYDPLYFSNAEIESKPVRIIGRVMELRAKF